jgi:hypothetical protein
LRSQVGDDGLTEIRAEIRSSAVWLILGFILGLFSVILKPIIVFGVAGAAAINVFCLIILLFYILILADITLSVFDIDFDPEKSSDN